MHVVGSIAEARKFVGEAAESKKSIGLVPTMGALHEGHASLIRRAVHRCDYVVLSLFVNPTQFGPSEDLSGYPRTLDADRQLADRLGVDLLFAPAAREMYGAGFATYVVAEGLADVLCGRSRPGHFRGVCTVVAKLFNIIGPDVAFFGQKDAQQAVIIQRMTEDLNFPIELEVLPTVREPDGLAMSSRNAYLSPAQRQDALALFRALQAAFELITRGQRDASAIRQHMLALLSAVPSARVDYVELADAHTLQPLSDLAGRQVLIAVAVHIGATRLIDNIVVDVS